MSIGLKDGLFSAIIASDLSVHCQQRHSNSRVFATSRPPSQPHQSERLGVSVSKEAMKVFEIINGSTLSLALFADVTNAKELLDSMQAGNLEPEVALLNASLIPDTFPVLAAAHKTLVAKARESLTTRTLHSELVYNYSGSKHITESLKRCGISETTTYILAARFGASSEEMTAVAQIINGREIGLEELEARANQAQIQKHYKISGPELAISSIGDAITCRIAARDAL